MSELHPIEILDRNPFKHMVATIGNLPTSFVDSMSYYECIAWLANYIKNTLIPALNADTEAIEELQAKYIELKDYVDHYFDNLDVQEEINNKLDAMAEAGTLQAIIEEYLQVNTFKIFDNITGLTGAENLIDGSYVKTLGFYNKGDAGGSTYKVRELTNQDTVDGAELVALTNYPALVAEMVNNGEVKPEQFGAKGDGETDDDSAIQNMFRYAYKVGASVKFPCNKTYLVGHIDLFTPISVDFNKSIIMSNGDDAETSVLNIGNPNDSFETKTSYNGKFNISNIFVDVNSTNRPYAVAINVRQQRFNSIKVRNCKNSGVYIGGNDGIWIEAIHAGGTNDNTSSAGVAINTNDIILGKVECAYFKSGVLFLTEQDDVVIDTLHVWSDVTNCSCINFSGAAFYCDIKSLIMDSTAWGIDLNSTGLGKMNIGNLKIFPSANFTNWRVVRAYDGANTKGITIGNVYGMSDADTTNRFENFRGVLSAGLNYNQKPRLYLITGTTNTAFNFYQNNGFWYNYDFPTLAGNGSTSINLGTIGDYGTNLKNITIDVNIYNSNYNYLGHGVILLNDSYQLQLRTDLTLASGTTYRVNIATPLPAGYGYRSA